jgi:hypothetical protein
MLRRWRWGLMSFAAIAGVAAAIALPGIQAAQTGARRAKLGVGVEMLRFPAAGKKLTATGLWLAVAIGLYGVLWWR